MRRRRGRTRHRKDESTRVAWFLVVRVTNADVYDNLDGVLEMIDKTLRPCETSPLTRSAVPEPLSPMGEAKISAKAAIKAKRHQICFRDSCDRCEILSPRPTD